MNGHGVARYLLSRAVWDAGIRVVFTGEGADEMPGGYAPFRRDVLLYDSEQQAPEVVQKLLDLKLRSGWHGDLFGKRPDGLTRAKLAEHVHGLDLGPMVERFPARLETASGRFELAAPLLVEDWARVRARFDAGAASDRLRLIGRRHVRSNNSWMHNLAPLMTGRSRCTLMMHPDDASARGLSVGDRAEIRARTGALTVEVEVTTDLMPGVVSLPHGFGHAVPGVRMDVAAAKPGVASNVLTDDTVLDTASGNGVLNGIPVEVAPAAAA